MAARAAADVRGRYPERLHVAEVHWFGDVRRNAIHQLVAEADRVKAEGKAVEGAMSGIAHAHANLAREAERDHHVARCAAKIMSKLIDDATKGLEPRSHSDLKKVLSGKKGAGGHSDRQLYGAAALSKVLADPIVANLGTHARYIGTAAA